MREDPCVDARCVARMHGTEAAEKFRIAFALHSTQQKNIGAGNRSDGLLMGNTPAYVVDGVL